MNQTNSDLEICRKHTASHILSAAVKMMYPESLKGVGPWTDDGFYQDFFFGEESISDKEFKKIQKKMRWIVNKNFKIEQVQFPWKKQRKNLAMINLSWN
jgi:threonyl-tRNA synthetase